jgi:uncharacterized protein YdiU (UPF0061 family)
MPVTAAYRPEALHLRLGDEFYDPVEAAQFPAHLLRFRNDRAARTVGLDGLTDPEWIAHFGRFEPLPGSLRQPLALRYHGHQFRSYNPDLGDGRGFLFAQLRDADGRLLDLGTKGSGQTPWSRRGDGRLTLKGGVREILATELLEALGVETSRSFSLVETGEALMRGDEPSPTRSSVLVRLSHSHIRIGTFQRLAAQGDTASIRHLLAHVIDHYMPHLAGEPEDRRPVAFLEEVCRRVARLGARYMAAGFVHGVLNSDNINVTGESFDYGPWRFVPVFDPDFTAAYFDETGLYAFGRQPNALFWNLARLAECLLSLASQEALEQALEVYEATLQAEFGRAILDRLGLQPRDDAALSTLTRTFVDFLMKTRAPFEQTFFDWYGGHASQARAARSPAADAYRRPEFAPLFAALAPFAPRADLRLDHAYFAGDRPCTLLIDEVEALWAPIADRDDWSAFEAKLEAIAAMRDAYGR